MSVVMNVFTKIFTNICVKAALASLAAALSAPSLSFLRSLVTRKQRISPPVNSARKRVRLVMGKRASVRPVHFRI